MADYLYFFRMLLNLTFRVLDFILIGHSIISVHRDLLVPPALYCVWSAVARVAALDVYKGVTPDAIKWLIYETRIAAILLTLFVYLWLYASMLVWRRAHLYQPGIVHKDK